MAESTTSPRYQVGTDAAGRWFGVWDTCEETWLYWGVTTRAEAAEKTRAANQLAAGNPR